MLKLETLSPRKLRGNDLSSNFRPRVTHVSCVFVKQAKREQRERRDPTVSVARDGVHRVGGGVSRGQRTLAYRYIRLDLIGLDRQIYMPDSDTDDIYESNSGVPSGLEPAETWNQIGGTVYLGEVATGSLNRTREIASLWRRVSWQLLTPLRERNYR